MPQCRGRAAGRPAAAAGGNALGLACVRGFVMSGLGVSSVCGSFSSLPPLHAMSHVCRAVGVFEVHFNGDKKPYFEENCHDSVSAEASGHSVI